MSNNSIVHYRKVFSSYHMNKYDDSISIDYYDNKISNRIIRVPKYGYFTGENRFQVNKEQYLKHYGYKFVGVESVNLTLVVEEYDNKLSLKLFENYRVRKVGGNHFRVRKNLTYITYNLKTKNFYFGEIQKKNKKNISNKIRTNYFSNGFAASLKLKIRRYVRDITNSPEINYIDNVSLADKISEGVVKVFSNILVNKTGIYFGNLRKFDDELFRFYLEHNGFKYPDTYYRYKNIKIFKRDLKKHINLVTLIMNKLELGGRKVKRILNQFNNTGLIQISHLYHFLGVDYFNKLNDEVFFLDQDSLDNLDLKKIKNYINQINFNISKRDKLRIVDALNNYLRYSIIFDHLKIISKLKKEYNYEFKMTFTDRKSFNQEHYEISKLLDSYSKGVISRDYGDYCKEKIEEVIYNVDGSEFYPVLLLTTDDYNEESAVQNNCVRTYIENPQSLIISLREGSCDGKDRATIEYRFRRNVMVRVQSLGKFNTNLSPMYNVPLEILDNLISELYKKNILHLPNMTKEYKTGEVIKSKAFFNNQEGILFNENPVWDNEKIKNEDFFDFDLFF